MQGKIAALRDLRGAHVGIDVGDERVSLNVVASPASAGGAAAVMVGALHPGDIAPLARVPQESVLALFSRDDPAARAKDASDLDATIVAALGARRWRPRTRSRVHEAFDDWGAARGSLGDARAHAHVGRPRRRGGHRVERSGANGARGSGSGGASWRIVPAIHDPFEAWLRAPGAESARAPARSSPDVILGAAIVPGGGEASTATFTTTRLPSRSSGRPDRPT